MTLSSKTCLHLSVLVASLMALPPFAAARGKNKKKTPAGAVATTLPKPNHPVNADFAGKVTYLGCDVGVDHVVLGQKLTVVHYWRVVEALGEGWRAFEHGEGGTSWQVYDHVPVHGRRPAETWKAGEIIEDEEEILVPTDWKSREIILWVGFFHRGDLQRLKVLSGPADDKNRVPALRLPVTPH